MPPARAVLYVASFGLLVLTGRAALLVPPSLPVAVGSLVAYFALILSGVLALRLRQPHLFARE